MKGKEVDNLVITAVIMAVVFWVVKQQLRKAQAASGETYLPDVGETEYEKLHKVVPITEHVEREIPVYGNIEEWEAENG